MPQGDRSGGGSGARRDECLWPECGRNLRTHPFGLIPQTFPFPCSLYHRMRDLYAKEGKNDLTGSNISMHFFFNGALERLKKVGEKSLQQARIYFSRLQPDDSSAIVEEMAQQYERVQPNGEVDTRKMIREILHLPEVTLKL